MCVQLPGGRDEGAEGRAMGSGAAVSIAGAVFCPGWFKAGSWAPYPSSVEQNQGCCVASNQEGSCDPALLSST